MTTAPGRAGRLVSVLRVLVLVVVGAVGAAAGFTHTHDWAVYHGQAGWLAWADAVVVECLVVVATFEVRRDYLAGRSGRLSLPMVVMIGALVVQMIAQVAMAEPTPAGWLVAAMPAVSFILIVKLALRVTKDPVPQAFGTTAISTKPAPREAASDAVSTNSEIPDRSHSPAPVGGSVRLPPVLAQRVTEVVEQARAEGRQVTADDIRRVTRVPGPLAERILSDLLKQ